MTNKEKCKELMEKLIGPVSASLVDNMTEEDCIETCRSKIKGFLGDDKARLFDEL